MSYKDAAQQFGDLIAEQKYAAAWERLTKEAQTSITPEGIQAAVAAMIAYGTGPILEAQVVEDAIVETWPGKQPNDLAVVYVALTGENFSEAVTLTLAQYGEGILIRQLEWGRP